MESLARADQLRLAARVFQDSGDLENAERAEWERFAFQFMWGSQKRKSRGEWFGPIAEFENEAGQKYEWPNKDAITPEKQRELQIKADPGPCAAPSDTAQPSHGHDSTANITLRRNRGHHESKTNVSFGLTSITGGNSGLESTRRRCLDARWTGSSLLAGRRFSIRSQQRTRSPRKPIHARLRTRALQSRQSWSKIPALKPYSKLKGGRPWRRG